MTGSALVELTDVGFGYSRHRPVLRGLHARFDAGMVHAVTGPSGCGKSTMLTILGLMLRPDRGRVVVAGADMTDEPDAARSRWRAEHIGFVFQDALLDPSMTVRANVLEGLPLGRSAREVRPAMEELLGRFGLTEFTRRRASQLSGGQGQRAALVRAMLKEPTILLADEPTGNLDDATAAVVLDALFEYGRRPGRTTIIVTHDTRVVDRVDRALRLTVVEA